MADCTSSREEPQSRTSSRALAHQSANQDPTQPWGRRVAPREGLANRPGIPGVRDRPAICKVQIYMIAESLDSFLLWKRQDLRHK